MKMQDRIYILGMPWDNGIGARGGFRVRGMPRTCDVAVRDLSQPRRHSMPVAVATVEPQHAAALRNLRGRAIG